MLIRSSSLSSLAIALTALLAGAVAAEAACPATIAGTSVRLRLSSTGAIVNCVKPNTNYELEVFGPSSNAAYCLSRSPVDPLFPATIGFEALKHCEDSIDGDIVYPRGFELRTDVNLPRFGIAGAVSPTCNGVDFQEEYAFSYPHCSVDGTACLAPPTGMVAWYGFDASSSYVADLAGSNDATRSGAVSVSGGRVGRGVDFDGFNDYVRAPDHNSLDFGAGDFSIDAWVRSTDTNATIVSKRAFSGGRYVGYLFMLFNGRLLLQMADPVNNWRNYADLGGPNVADGNWHLVAVTIDRDNPFGGRMFLDGDLIFTFNPQSRSGDLSNAVTLDIGQVTGGGSGFNGVIDEVELFDRVLSASEVRALYLVGSSGKCKPTPPTPLTANLICTNSLSNSVFCEANTFGGTGGYTFSWSRLGEGTLTSNGSSALLARPTCNFSSTITVTVGDGTSTVVTRSSFMPCRSSGCGPGICPDPNLPWDVGD